ncbi:hypothetical protein ACHAW5_001810 [Stephanodiscus triporus]|uniref:Branched-chain-amino-acid transaminase n=1 Tax=Stephanodiscus triporus TaxID=2934178 RepID=A0ABD3QBN5_9STRA
MMRSSIVRSSLPLLPRGAVLPTPPLPLLPLQSRDDVAIARSGRGVGVGVVTTTTRRSITSSELTVMPHPPDVLASLKSNRPPKEELKFGQTFSPHMLTVKYDKNHGGWSSPEIVPYGDLKLSPASSALHYGMECFEGMKAYRALKSTAVEGEEGGVEDLRLFRPDRNVGRLRDSMARLGMPGADFDSDEMIECIKELVRLGESDDGCGAAVRRACAKRARAYKDWIPSGRGYSLYLRPTVISTHPYLGLSPPDSLLFYVITCPVGPYYATGFDPIRLTTDTPFVRAWPGGSGSSKIGGNYGPTMMPGAEAHSRGYSQILWTFGEEGYVTEVGAMNVFFLLEKKEVMGGGGGRRKELVTPPLTRGDILPGVTRQSILELTRIWDEFDVVERSITMSEVKSASDDGRLIEAFGAGTAAVVTPISHVQYRGEDIVVPNSPGELAVRLFDDLVDIQYGVVEGPEGWSVRI